MKLYIAEGSPNCRKVRAVVSHLGLDVETQVLDPAQGEHKQAPYLAINPNGRVPALVDGDMRLWESNAIMQFLCDQHGEVALFPQDLHRRANVVRWLYWDLAHYSNHLAKALFERVFKPFVGAGPPDERQVERSLTAFWPLAQILNDQVRDRAFVCGNDVTIADFSLGSQTALASHGRVDLKGFPHLCAWLARLDEIPAWHHTAMAASMLALLAERLQGSST